jgi:hypothetical protein
MTIAERRGSVLYDRATERSPHTVLLNRAAARRPCASEGRVRVRGSARQRSVAFAACPGAGAGVQSIARGQGQAPMCAWACRDAVGASLQSTGFWLLPSCPSEAPGSPPPLPSLWRNFGRAHAVLWENLSEPARASVWASPVNAWPCPCFFSSLRRACWPGGCSRRQRLAALENAPWSEAWPILVPEKPERVPVDAWAHCTRRQEETQSWPWGKRWMVGSSYRSARRRLGPIPGMV